jgi:hypothetical protein
MFFESDRLSLNKKSRFEKSAFVSFSHRIFVLAMKKRLWKKRYHPFIQQNLNLDKEQGIRVQLGSKSVNY